MGEADNGMQPCNLGDPKLWKTNDRPTRVVEGSLNLYICLTIIALSNRSKFVAHQDSD